MWSIFQVFLSQSNNFINIFKFLSNFSFLVINRFASFFYYKTFNYSFTMKRIQSTINTNPLLNIVQKTFLLERKNCDKFQKPSLILEKNLRSLQSTYWKIESGIDDKPRYTKWYDGITEIFSFKSSLLLSIRREFNEHRWLDIRSNPNKVVVFTSLK